ncbi:NUDIX domain-containing protein [Cumulibacter manganitolerans]|uniref:NUDIX domain-containing protein n=1 Tax=Cumulibacter manganitolerans TaxID=1884992 RepID=UPI0018860A60|nr:NUDIX domain-containing protein [Cumulibacter manganitolerans]
MSIEDDQSPVLRQRIGAYGVLVRDDRGLQELLLTRISPTDYGAGMWTLPGGGIDHGEHPDDAVVREVYEETSLMVRVRAVHTVANLHVIGHNRQGVLEDFQGVGIIYSVEPVPGSDLDRLRVVEEDSSTDLVEWVAFEQLTLRRLTNVAWSAVELLGIATRPD